MLGNPSIGLMGGKKTNPPTMSYIGTYSGNATSTSVSISSVGFGATGTNRRVVLAVAMYHTYMSTTYTLSGATIGGISATIHLSDSINEGEASLATISALVPTGTTGTVVLTFSNSATYYVQIKSYRIVSDNATTLDYSYKYTFSHQESNIYSHARSFTKNTANISHSAMTNLSVDTTGITWSGTSSLSEDVDTSFGYVPILAFVGRHSTASLVYTSATASKTTTVTGAPTNDYYLVHFHEVGFK